MDKRLNDILNGREGNHLLPFLWMREGHHDELPALIQTVYDSGARAFCVESRRHESFCEQRWWDDMDLVLAEAEKRGMRVWILDDKNFPTGYANGLVAKKYPERRKWQLAEDHIDLVGPAPQNAALLRAQDEENILLGVFAYRRRETDETLDARPVDLTDRVKGRYVYWDVPAGVWRVMALYKTRRGTQQTEYMHLIDEDSVRVLIEAVYEPHYAHYAKYFGNTLAGFFSDEPSLGNCQTVHGAGDVDTYNQRLGQPGLALPWTDELLERLSEALGATRGAGWRRCGIPRAMTRPMSAWPTWTSSPGCGARTSATRWATGAGPTAWSTSATSSRTKTPTRACATAWATTSGRWTGRTWPASTWCCTRSCRAWPTTTTP